MTSAKIESAPRDDKVKLAALCKRFSGENKREFLRLH